MKTIEMIEQHHRVYFPRRRSIASFPFSPLHFSRLAGVDPRYHPDKNPDEASKAKFAEIRASAVGI